MEHFLDGLAERVGLTVQGFLEELDQGCINRITRSLGLARRRRLFRKIPRGRAVDGRIFSVRVHAEFVRAPLISLWRGGFGEDLVGENLAKAEIMGQLMLEIERVVLRA